MKEVVPTNLRESITRQVFIAPLSKEHINNSVITDKICRRAKEIVSIEGLIPVDLVSDALTDEEERKLWEIFPDGKIRIWGTTEANEAIWDSINTGDYVLFYKRGYYIFLAEIALKMNNKGLAEKVWGEYQAGETWNLIFFVKNVQPIQISREKLNKIAGYNENFVPRGFMRVNEEAAKKIIAEIIMKKTKIEGRKMTVKDVLNHLEKEKEFSKIIKTAFAHLIAGKNIVFYGAPATSKTYLAKKICESICGEKNFSIETANAEWSHFDIIGGKTTNGFKEGIVLKAIKECEKSINNGRPYWLIIDELNRANLDLAFGEIFTQLDIDHREKPLKPYGAEEEYFVPLSFRIIATMNTYDRSLLFSLGYAFMRRFAFIQVESLFKHTEEEEGELKVPDDIKNIISDDRIKRIKKIAFSSVLKHFCTKKGEDRAFLFEDFELTRDQLEEILNQLKINELDIIDLLNYISYKMTNEGLVEIGHAIVFDAVKFAIAHHLLFPKASIRELLDEAVSAYLLPQLEYFMPKLRKGKIFGEKKIAESWNNIKSIFEKLNLPFTLKRLNEAEEEFRVI
mgnify:CR=1 FL=1